MSARVYAGGAASSTLSGAITSGATSIAVADASTWPSTGAFSIVIDRGIAGEEKILIASRVGNTLTATTRGYDSTTAAAHATAAVVECCATATDFQEANDHVNASTNVHGLTGGAAVVGTTQSQTLTNKTLTAPVVASIVNTGTLTLPTSTDTLVGRATTDTLTGKSVALGSNTVTGTTAQFNTALTDNDFATLAGTEALTNKTLTSPTITSPTVTSGTLDAASTIGGVSGTSLAADRTAWGAYTPTWGTSGTPPALGNGTLTGRFKQSGKTVYFSFVFTAGSTSTFGTGSFLFSLPATRVDSAFGVPVGAGLAIDATGPNVPVTAVSNNSTQLLLYTPASGAVTASVPQVWAVNDQIYVSGTYESS